MGLNSQQYESIMRGYEELQSMHRQMVEERRSLIYKEIPEYKELDSSVAELANQKLKLLLSGDENALNGLHLSIQDITNRKSSLLKEKGYPTNYLEPIYKCPACKDTGYVDSESGYKTKCSCFRNQEIAILYQQSNIQDMIEKENFSTLSYDYYQGEDLLRFQKATQICKQIADTFPNPYQNLFLYGTVGTGKSFLSGCIAKELLNKGFSVIYFSAVGLFDTLARYSFDTKSKETLYNFYKDLYNCDLVIIDDLGTEVTNSFVTSQLFSCLNERHMRKKASIISTNLSLEDLRDRYSDRVFSRITSNFTLCKLTGPDVRMCKKRNLNSFNA